MSRFSDSVENDSFDEILATMDVPIAKTSSSQVKNASPAKKLRLSFDNDDDSLLANVVMPEASTSTTQPTAKPTANVPISAGKTNCVLVNPKQRGIIHLNYHAIQSISLANKFSFSGNPILKSITNVPWEFDDSIIPDYVVGKTAGILFLSLRYHSLNPDYIHNRLKELGKRFELRVLLVQVDTKVCANMQFHHKITH